MSHHEIFYDVAKYSLTSHGIFFHVASMVCSKTNNGLLTLAMVVAKKAIESTNALGQ